MVSKRVIIITANEFEDLELYYPMFRLQEAGHKVDIAVPRQAQDDLEQSRKAAPDMKPIHGEHGYGMKPTLTIDQVDPEDYDLLIIPGGFPDGAPATVRKIKKAQEIAQAFFKANKPVAAVCHGPWLLADANVVKGRHVTSFWHDGVPESLKDAGANWEDKDVVVDGNLVTSRWPLDLPVFMREVMKLIS